MKQELMHRLLFDSSSLCSHVFPLTVSTLSDTVNRIFHFELILREVKVYIKHLNEARIEMDYTKIVTFD